MIYNDSNTNMSFVVHVSKKGVSMAVKHNEVSGLCSVFFFFFFAVITSFLACMTV